MSKLLLACLALSVVVIGCGSEPTVTAPTATPTDTSATGKKGASLGAAEATPLMSSGDAEKRVGSAGK